MLVLLVILVSVVIIAVSLAFLFVMLKCCTEIKEEVTLPTQTFGKMINLNDSQNFMLHQKQILTQVVAKNEHSDAVNIKNAYLDTNDTDMHVAYECLRRIAPLIEDGLYSQVFDEYRNCVLTHSANSEDFLSAVRTANYQASNLSDLTANCFTYSGLAEVPGGLLDLGWTSTAAAQFKFSRYYGRPQQVTTSTEKFFTRLFLFFDCGTGPEMFAGAADTSDEDKQNQFPIKNLMTHAYSQADANSLFVYGGDTYYHAAYKQNSSSQTSLFNMMNWIQNWVQQSQMVFVVGNHDILDGGEELNKLLTDSSYPAFDNFDAQHQSANTQGWFTVSFEENSAAGTMNILNINSSFFAEGVGFTTGRLYRDMPDTVGNLAMVTMIHRSGQPNGFLRQDFLDFSKLCLNMGANDLGDKLDESIYMESPPAKMIRSCVDGILNSGASDDRIMILCHNPVQDIFFPGTVSSTLDISESGELDTNGLAHCTVFGQEVLMVLVASLFANDSQWTGTLTVYIICGHVHTAGYWNDFTITYGSRSILVKEVMPGNSALITYSNLCTKTTVNSAFNLVNSDVAAETQAAFGVSAESIELGPSHKRHVAQYLDVQMIPLSFKFVSENSSRNEVNVFAGLN